MKVSITVSFDGEEYAASVIANDTPHIFGHEAELVQDILKLSRAPVLVMLAELQSFADGLHQDLKDGAPEKMAEFKRAWEGLTKQALG